MGTTHFVEIFICKNHEVR